MRRLSVGDRSPVWKLMDQNEKTVDLKQFLGKKTVLLSFHPLAWTPVCAQQMKDLERKYGEFERSGAVALGMSVDSVPCKSAWADSLGIKKTSLPADFWPHGGVAKLYDLLIGKYGFSARAAVIIDRDGVIAFKKIYPMGKVPDIGEQIERIKRLEMAAV